MKAAAIQMVSGDDLRANLDEAARLIGEAAGAGARLVVLPENFAFMGKRESDKLAIAERPGIGPMQDFLAQQASCHKLWLVGGTIPLSDSGGASRAYASCLVHDPDGKQHARYDKIHLFDVGMPGSKEHYAESRSTLAGEEIRVLDTPCGRLGLAVCYDLRFPEQFRKMSAENVEIIAVPSAFTATTGRAHWELLLRARAVENLCYVVAPDQGGRHPNTRETWGDSMIVDPWGEILCRRAKGPGVVVGEIDLAQLRRTRERFPVLEHRRIKV